MCIESQCNVMNEYNEYPSITRSIATATACSQLISPVEAKARKRSARFMRIRTRHTQCEASCLQPHASCQDPRQTQARPEQRVVCSEAE